MPNDKSRKIILRDEAIDLGLIWYYTGLPCKHGHVDERQTINAQCKTCQKDGQARHRADVRRRMAEARSKSSAAE